MAVTKTFASEDIRNIALVGHGASGKTALAEAMLFNAGVTTRLGKTADATSTFDFEPEEVHRGGSICTGFGSLEHNGKKLNLIDTPGDQNFCFDGLTSMQGADAAVVVISATDGVQLQTRRAWDAAVKWEMPRLIVVNKMDREIPSPSDIVARINSTLGIQAVPVQLPIGKSESFRGVVDLLSRQALTFTPDGSGKVAKGEIPADLASAVDEAAASFMESVVSTDDALLEKYLEAGDVNADEVRRAFMKAVADRKLIPLLYSSASLNMCVQPVLDLLAEAVPAPLCGRTLSARASDGSVAEVVRKASEPFLGQVIHTLFDEHSGQVSILRVFCGEPAADGRLVNARSGEDVRLGQPYQQLGRERVKIDAVVCGDIISAVKLKDTRTNDSLCAPGSLRTLPGMEYPAPMISYVLLPESKGDEDKLKVGVQRLIDEDPTLSISFDELSHRMVLNGMGHGHLENAVERMRRKSKVSVKTDLPMVPYRETFAKVVRDVEGKHKKQTGGAGQFGVCYVDIEPLDRDKGFEFVDKIFGGAIPRQFIPSVEKGVVERAKRGLLAGYPVVDFRLLLKDGKYHPVDSKDIAFQMAGVKALKAAMEKAGMKLLEPYYRMEIVAPSENAGDVMGDISTRRGQIAGMDTQGEMSVIRATCPMAEVRRYVPDLHALTGGKGSFTMEFDSYREVPAHLVEKIRSESPFHKVEEADED